jgi:hypothetical protein
MNILEDKFQTRQSKCEDLDEIETLKTTLVFKDRELSRCQ